MIWKCCLIILCLFVIVHAEDEKSTRNNPPPLDFGNLGGMFADLMKDEAISKVLGEIMKDTGGSQNMMNMMKQMMGDDDGMKNMMASMMGTQGIGKLFETFKNEHLQTDKVQEEEHEGKEVPEGDANKPDPLGDILGKIGGDPLGDILGKIGGAQGMEKLVDSFGGEEKIQQMMSNFAGPEGVGNLLDQLGTEEGLNKLLDNFGGDEGLTKLMENFGGEDAITKMMDSFLNGGGIDNLFGNQSPFGAMFKSMLGGEAGGIDEMMKGFLSGDGFKLPKVEPTPPPASPPLSPDLERFASLVETLGGLEKVVEMMNEMGMTDMLEKAGGVDALKTLLDQRKADAGSRVEASQDQHQEL
jgi:hypothetical protein